MKSSSRAAITASAMIMITVISVPVARSVSSAVVAAERLLPASGPELSLTMSRIASSTSASPSSSSAVSPSPSASARRRMAAIATVVPSASAPTSRPSGSWTAAPSTCSWDSDAKSSVPSACANRNVGETTAPSRASSGCTRGSDVASVTALWIWARPAGVSAAPRKRSVAETVSCERPKRSSIVSLAMVTSLSSGRKTVLSACGASRVMPDPSAIVMASSASSVASGRTVTSQLSPSSTRVIARTSLIRPGSGWIGATTPRGRSRTMHGPDHHDDTRTARREALLDRIERGTELPLMILSFALIPLLVAPLLWELRPASQAVAFACGIAIWVVFTAELFVRLVIAPRRGPYLRQHWLDALAVLLPVVRPLRILWIARYGSRAYRRPLRFAHVDFLGAYAVGLVLVIATIVTSLERGHDSPIDSFPDALWWSIATVTTVGYGDVVPVTAAGRAFAYVLMLGGIGLFGALTANLASMLARREDPSVAALASLRDEVRELREALEGARERDGASEA